MGVRADSRVTLTRFEHEMKAVFKGFLAQSLLLLSAFTVLASVTDQLVEHGAGLLPYYGLPMFLFAAAVIATIRVLRNGTLSPVMPVGYLAVGLWFWYVFAETPIGGFPTFG